MIRVLHALRSLDYQGVEAVILNLYRNIDREKVQFDFVVSNPGKGKHDGEVEAMGGKIYYLPKRSKHPFKYYRLLKKIFKNNPQYKIFHCNTNSAGAYVDLRAAKKSKVPVRISHSHNSNSRLKFQHKLFKPFLKFVVTDKFSCSDEASLWMFSSTENVIVLNNAVDTKKFKPDLGKRTEVRKALNIENDFVIGHTGSFQDRKNQTFLVDLLEKILPAVPNAKLMLVGDGGTRTAVEEKVKGKNLENNVLFLGNRNDIPDILQAMDIFVFPSLFEGLSVALNEAQASGLKCLCSSVISEKSDISGNLTFLPLDNIDLWADEVIKSKNNFVRTDVSDIIKERGFDIESQAKWLENFYLEKYKKY